MMREGYPNTNVPKGTEHGLSNVHVQKLTEPIFPYKGSEVRNLAHSPHPQKINAVYISV